MDNIDDFIKDIVSKELKPHDSFDSTIYSTFETLGKRKKSKLHNLKFDLAIACCFMFLITGVVFAKEIENFVKAQFENFGLGRGVDTAIDNGYVGKPENDDISQNVPIIENNEVIDNINVKVKIDEFLMTDSCLSLDFYFEFENKICDYVSLGELINGNVDYEGSHIISLSDLFIVDENNEVLYFNRWDCENFKKYCEENNMKFDYPDYDVIGMSSIAREYNKDAETLGVNEICNISSTNKFPNSKKINIYFTKIDLINNESHSRTENFRNITLKGDWKFSLDVPENMYNRTSDSYRVVSCDNEDFNVYEAKLTDIGFEIGIEISNLKKPILSEDFLEKQSEILQSSKGYIFNTKKEFLELFGDEKYLKIYEEYMRDKDPIKTDGLGPLPWSEATEGCYIKNSNNEKFLCSTNVNDINKADFINENTYNYYGTFSMTKYDATDKITVIIDFKGKPVKIDLEKINN